jgi:ribosomal protein L29
MNKKLNETRNMGTSELLLKLKDLKNELAREKATKSTNTRPENPGKAKGLRKQVARIFTIMKEKELVANKNKLATSKKSKKGEVKH